MSQCSLSPPTPSIESLHQNESRNHSEAGSPAGFRGIQAEYPPSPHSPHAQAAKEQIDQVGYGIACRTLVGQAEWEEGRFTVKWDLRMIITGMTYRR